MNWLNKLKTEFKRRVLECHYRLVEFSKPEVGAKWWSIQKLGTTGWKEVETEWTYEDAENTLNRYVNEFVLPKQKVLKEV